MLDFLAWLSPVGVIASAVWALASLQTMRVMQRGAALTLGCIVIGLIALSIAGALADAPTLTRFCLFGAVAIVLALVWTTLPSRTPVDRFVMFSAAALMVVLGLVAALQGIAPLIVLLSFFPLFADAVLTLLWRMQHKIDATEKAAKPLYEIGLDAGLSRLQVDLAYWAASLHCGLVAIVASEVHRGAMSTLGQTTSALSGLARLASFTPQFAVIVLSFAAWKVSFGIRRYALARRTAETEAV